MTKTLSFAALLALPLITGAHAASPATYCTFTSPASITCPNDVAPPAHAAPVQVTATDHCVALTPASTACPAAPSSLADTGPVTPTTVQVSRN